MRVFHKTVQAPDCTDFAEEEAGIPICESVAEFNCRNQVNSFDPFLFMERSCLAMELNQLPVLRRNLLQPQRRR